ncbi:MAG TPA: cobalt-precorrin-5B (C(1))-methyltransferase [Stellaceae bacterium]|nr:cobalt-precorrin-5B (C(1))-methyltransferase [Stellaceae bacterium]
MAHPKPVLRRGWSTGACAAAAARAAFEALVSGQFPDPVTIALPGGERPRFALAVKERRNGMARAGIIKDAGDDPDVTHGATVIAEVTRASRGAGVVFHAGEGVGTVTLPGLPLAVGEPAINPGPRAIIAAALGEVEPAPDVEVTLSIPGGATLAARTMNARLGIIGGLSILGTTGIVVPYSCSAWIASIERGIDVARAAGVTHIAAATGRTSEAAVQRLHGLAELALIDMGDFAGGVLKYLRRHPVPRLTLAGGIAKMTKLAEGHLDLHSARSRIGGTEIARRLARIGVPETVVAADDEGASVGAAMAALEAPLAEAFAASVAADARQVALDRLGPGIAVDVVLFDRAGKLLAHAGP